MFGQGQVQRGTLRVAPDHVPGPERFHLRSNLNGVGNHAVRVHVLDGETVRVGDRPLKLRVVRPPLDRFRHRNRHHSYRNSRGHRSGGFVRLCSRRGCRRGDCAGSGSRCVWFRYRRSCCRISRDGGGGSERRGVGAAPQVQEPRGCHYQQHSRHDRCPSCRCHPPAPNVRRLSMPLACLVWARRRGLRPDTSTRWGMSTMGIPRRVANPVRPPRRLPTGRVPRRA